MKINVLARTVGATAVAFAIAAGTVVTASATNDIQQFGEQEMLNGYGVTVTGLMPSSDAIPYPVAGRLYEATVTIDAFGGSVTPVVPMFNARAENGANYRVLANVFTPQGLSGASIPPGGSSSGKIYFDVVGTDPNSVVVNDGGQDLLAWVP